MIISENTVAIMMATYNGEKYIQEQIESILGQRYRDWVLFVRDDGSTDGTLGIIEDYCARYPERIVTVPRQEGEDKQGSKFNFAYLHRFVSENYDFRYFMFCDQDDVWKEDKVKRAIERIKKEETTTSSVTAVTPSPEGKAKEEGATSSVTVVTPFPERKAEKPILYHSDLTVVDQDLKVLDPSFFHYRSLNAENPLNAMLIQNNVTGCTMAWNRAMNDLVGDMTDDRIIMHDWWFSLLATLMGKTVFDEQPGILYRQHTDNVVGATKVNSLSFIVNRFKDLKRVKYTLHAPFDQAELILERQANILQPEQKCELTRFAGLKQKNKLQRVISIFRYGYLKKGLVQVIGEVLFI